MKKLNSILMSSLIGLITIGCTKSWINQVQIPMEK